jgi:hypothetical protein
MFSASSDAVAPVLIYPSVTGKSVDLSFQGQYAEREHGTWQEYGKKLPEHISHIMLRAIWPPDYVRH